MKTIIFREELTPESVQELIDKIEQPHEDIVEHDIRILFSSIGGHSDMAEALIDCINGLDKEFNLELVVTYQAVSGAFDVFVKAKCKKRLYRNANGVVHLFDRSFSSRDVINSKNSYDKHLLAEINDMNAEYLEWLEELGIFTGKELKRISRGKDVYVERERLQKIIDKQSKKQ